MQWLAALSVRRPVFATVLILSLTVIGAFSFMLLGVDRFPKVDFPTVVVTTVQPGASPEQIETEITDKIEEAVNTISGIDELRSVSSEGVSIVFVGFLLDKPADVAAQEVRDKVNGVLPLLPRSIDQPRVEKFDPDAAPVLSLAVTAKKPVRAVTEYVDKVLRRQLESVTGVGQVLVLGGRERQINVWLDADRLRAHNLTVTDVSRALQAQNIEIPGGRVDQGSRSITLRTEGRVTTVEAFNEIVVREQAGHPVRVGDVARVEDGEAESESVANLDGTGTVLLQVRRQSGTNTVEVVKAVKGRLAEVQPLLPPGYDVRVVRDLSEFIEASIHSVEEHLVLGSILAALVVLVFLMNVRSTAIAAVAIPTSIIATFGLIWYMGFTLNSMTMLALTLSVGIVIDDAIVVLENIYRFIEEKGINPFEAAVAATKEIGLAVLATTLSLVAIFVPVAFMGGIVGRFMESFGLTMAFAILVSLLVSFTLTPMLSARLLKVDGNGRNKRSSKDSAIFRAIDRVYARLLDSSMAHRAAVSGLAVTPVAYSLFDDLSKVRLLHSWRPALAGLREAVSVRGFFTIVAVTLASTAPTYAQGAPVMPERLRLTVDEAVRLALEHNVDLKADRLDPQIGDARVAAAAGAFRPAISSNVLRNNQLQPPASLLTPTPTRTDVVTSTVGVDQRLPWFGTSYRVAWDASHTESDSFLNSYNPLLRSGLSLNISQPLLRDFSTDDRRLQMTQSQLGRNVADARLRESLVQVTAGVKRAYWNLVSALANVEARQTAVQLAEELARVNRAKVDVGQSPPLDLLSAQAEVAANQEQLIIAETSVKLAEDRLRLLIFDPTDRPVWNIRLEPIDTPPVAMAALDVDAAVIAALRDRADLSRARTGIAAAQTTLEFAGNQRLPDVRLNASYQASGLGGTQLLRAGGFPGTILGPGTVTNFASVLDQLGSFDYPTWAVGVSVSYPIGRSSEEAAHARQRLERAQAGERLKSAEARVIQQVRDAAWKIEMNARRIETTRAARALAEQRLDAERKRFDVGMSTSFLVIQAQRDFAQAQTNELASVLAYDLALVDFEAVQAAGPALAQ